MNTRTNMLLVQSPETIVFPLLLASPVTRFLAWSIDCGCIMVVCYAVSAALALFALVSPDLASALIVLGYFVISVLYGVVLEWFWRGRTIGKRLFRLRVMDAHGLRLQFSQVVIRNLLRPVDKLPIFYMVGGLSCLFHRCNQRLGDLAANTIVIRTPQIHEPDLDQLLAGKYNSFRDHPHLTGRLKQRVSAGEAGVAVQALMRRDQLEAAARVQLFGQIADHFRHILRFPQEATDGLTDEQYVRNVVDILFRSPSVKRIA